MKKVNIVLLSILTMLLSGVLMACTFKKPEVNFLSEEKILSLSKLEEKSVDLKDLIEVVGVEKSDVEFRFSNSALFEIEGSVITAVESGCSFVYATYQNNSLDSMQLIVKKPFDAPQSFSMSETALLSWSSVSGTFETGKGIINAETYNLFGTYTAEDGTVSPFNVKNLSRTSYQLTEKGKYELSVYANGVGYFDDGASATQTFYVGYMPLLEQSDFTWSNGVLSWADAVLDWDVSLNAKYQVEFDGEVIGDFQTETSIDLSDRLDAVSAGVHTVSVTVADVSTEEDRKLNQKSEALTIRKLATPTAQLTDGQIVLPTQSNVEEFDIVLTAKDDETDKIVFNGEVGSSTSLNELDELRKTNIVFKLAVVAKHESTENGFFYHSNARDLGYICKLPTTTLTGTGDNSFNGTLFNAKVQTSQVPVNTTLEIYGLSTSTTLAGVSAGENLKEFSLTVSEVGVYTLSAMQKASEQNYVVNGTPVYVLNSNISDTLTMTKLAQVQGEITHQYVGNKSAFTFQSVENATKYQLQRWTGSTFDVEKEIDATESQTQTIVLQDKIENLFEVIDGKYSFQIVAKMEDDALTINSSTEKVLQSLGTAQSQESSRVDKTNKTYSWGEVSNADSYLLKIFVLTKEEYDNQSMNVGTSQTEEVGTDSAEYTFAEEGYYCVQVYAISGDENSFISSVDCLEEFVLVAEQTELGGVQFGFDASLPNEEGLTDASGYFVKIAPTENVTNYKLYVDKDLASEKLYTFSATGTNDAKTYLLMEDFASGSHTLSLTGYGDDDAVYLPTSAFNLTVERLAGVTTSDFNTGKLLVNDFKSSQSVTVKTKEGARSVIVNVSDGSSKSNEGDVTIDTSNLSNFKLEIDFAGSRFDSTTHTYTVTDGKVYLDAETSTVDFSRLDAPTGLQYYDGALNFTHTQIADKAYYVVDISCTTANNEKFSLSIKFDNIVTAVYGVLNVPLGAQSDYVSVSNGNDVAIDIGKVIAFLKTNETLASIYNQAKEINFAVYAYQTRVVGDKFVLSSGYASTLADASKTSISVPKLESTNLTFSYTSTENILSWDAVTTDSSVSAETTYEMYVDGETDPRASTTATTYTFDASLIGKTFYVKATNPYYLESSNSNNVTVHKLSKLNSISLTDGGKLVFRVSAGDVDACTSAKLSIDGGEASTISLTSGVGEIEIRQRGTYSITLVGTTARESAGMYYIDSDVSTWTVKNLSEVAPESLEVTIENNQISWNGLGSLDALEYVLIFKDEENGTGVFKTTSTAVNWLTDDTLRESLENLASGNILLGLSAHIKVHSVVAGGTIYFGEETTLLNGSVEFNHIKYGTTSVTYGTQTIKKLTTPEIEKVEFINVSAEDYTQTPNVKVTISGNYGTNGAFQIYRKENSTPIKTLTITADGDGNYEFTLTAGDYNNYVSVGEELVFEIYAINQGENVEAIASSKRELKFTRADNLSSIVFAQDDFGFTKVVEITLPSENVDQILGGIVLKFTFDDGTTTTTKYALASTSGAIVDENEQNYVVTYDASALIEQYLASGGTLKVEAFVQSDASETYILASNTIATTDHSVLKSLSTSDIERKDYGFEISNVNGEDCVYVVNYSGKLFEVSKESDFAFEVPNDWDEKFNPYNLTIYATESGKISSKGLAYAFNLDRIASVQEVTISRTDNNPATISWDDVTGASGYILKVYSRLTDGTKGSLLTEVEGTATSYTFEQLFGAGYENLLGSGKLNLSDLESGCDIWIELITKGGESKNNSKALDVRANIVGNPLTAENVVTNEFGNLTLVEGDGQTFLDKAFIYRFVSGSGELLYSSDSELLSVWTLCEDNLLDTTMLESDGSAFNVEIIFLGSLQASSTDSAFELDSMLFSSVNLSLTFYKMESISNVAVDASLGGGLAITLPTDNFSNIYVGFTPDAILKGELDGTDGVVAIETAFVGNGTENNEFIYSYKLADLISIMSSVGLNYGENSIYFWLCREGEAPYYVASDAYQFTFNLTEDPQFSKIEKGTYTAVGGEEIEDYINTFAVFENNDTATNITLGIFVKLSWEKDGVTEEFTQFVSLDKLLGYSDRFAGYAINLTEIFESEMLSDLSGTFTVDFARASLQNAVYTMSNWLSATNGTMEFERLDKTANVSIRNGNLSWTESGEKATKYCIYFYTNVEAKTYSTLFTTLTSLNVSDFVGSEDAYYIAVQAINEDDLYVLSSRQTFKLGADDKPQAIYKNQIRSPLTLVDGKLLINWTTGDTDSNFYDVLMQTTGNYAELARTLVTTTFTSPFTFTLKDLVSGNIYVRLRFSSTDAGGMTKTFDVNAINLLANLAEFESGGAMSRLSVLYNAEENPTYKNLISEFRKAITESTYGVANPNAIFDKYFEALQIGAYSLEYCLTTSSATLNSQWYSFENENGENVIYINEEPTVTAKIESNPTQQAINEFKVIVKKSEIWDYESGDYVKKTAENYVMKLGSQSFAIYLAGSQYKLALLNGDNSQTVSVYECDAMGTPFENGEYLMFYLNHNDGDSLQGVFNLTAQGTQEMQIYAVGNNFSVSSKSQYFHVTFLNFGTFGVTDGVFNWTTHLNRNTSVFVKRSTDLNYAPAVTIDGSRVTASYGLETYSAGTYSLKFIIEGEVRGNVIIVDSEMLFVENVYKLSAPILSNVNGYLGFDTNSSGGVNTAEQLSNSYSDADLYRYLVYNNNSGSGLSMNFSDTRSDKSGTFFYEAGITDLTESEPDYAYKRTEEFATSFYASMLGSTATLACEVDADKYYLRNVKCLDLNGQTSTLHIALRSEIASLEASMLDAISKSVRIENGMVVWDEVTGKYEWNSATSSYETLGVESGAQIVYKVTISKYKKSATASGTVDTKVVEDVSYYTTNTHFDLSLLEKADVDDDDVYIKVKIQALSLFVSEEEPVTTYVELIEGGYGYGNVKFDGVERFVLMGNGAEIKDVTRLKNVYGLGVVDGKLSWSFDCPSALTTSNFLDYYTFLVVDDEGKEISGTYSLSQDGNTFKVIFTENVGEMKSGTYDISVYVLPGARNSDLSIKSFAEVAEITKLATISSSDYEIVSDIETDSEVLTLESYFSDSKNASNIVVATIKIGVETFDFNLTQTAFKVHILREDDADFVIDGDAVGYVVIGGGTAGVTFKVINYTNINSDASQEFSLHRVDWQAYSVSWDTQMQQFVWDYDLYSLSSEVSAQKTRYAYILKTDATLYTDAEMTDERETLASGTEVEMLEEGEGSSKILYNEEEYYILASTYERQILEVTEGETTETLQTNQLFEIVEEKGEHSIVDVSGQLYKIPTSYIVNPIFIVEATITKLDGTTQVRTYETTEKHFQPTVIGKVKIAVQVKVNALNLLSNKLESEEETFDLFVSGDGTSDSPYLIASVIDGNERTAEEVFQNLAYRMIKDGALTEYVLDGETVTEEDKFHFQLQEDIDLGSFDGILFDGEFGGVIDGGDHTITYTSTEVEQLSSDVVIGENETAMYVQSGVVTLTYSRASALFDTLTSSANIKNLKLDVKYGEDTFVAVYFHSLIAGLAVRNNGRVESVTVVGFENHFYGAMTDRLALAYSGVVAINEAAGVVTNCKADANMSINDNRSLQLISLSGVVYTNRGIIENCVSGNAGSVMTVNSQKEEASLQVSGIATTNTSSGTIRNSTNNFKFEVWGTSDSRATCYIGGIVVLGKGTLSNNTNSGSYETLYIPNMPANYGEIYVKQS